MLGRVFEVGSRHMEQPRDIGQRLAFAGRR
jgi:hypothetical protein